MTRSPSPLLQAIEIDVPSVLHTGSKTRRWMNSLVQQRSERDAASLRGGIVICRSRVLTDGAPAQIQIYVHLKHFHFPFLHGSNKVRLNPSFANLATSGTPANVGNYGETRV